MPAIPLCSIPVRLKLLLLRFVFYLCYFSSILFIYTEWCLSTILISDDTRLISDGVRVTTDVTIGTGTIFVS